MNVYVLRAWDCDVVSLRRWKMPPPLQAVDVSDGGWRPSLLARQNCSKFLFGERSGTVEGYWPDVGSSSPSDLVYVITLLCRVFVAFSCLAAFILWRICIHNFENVSLLTVIHAGHHVRVDEKEEEQEEEGQQKENQKRFDCFEICTAAPYFAILK